LVLDLSKQGGRVTVRETLVFDGREKTQPQNPKNKNKNPPLKRKLRKRKRGKGKDQRKKKKTWVSRRE